MKKITLKISAFLLLAMFALQVQGQDANYPNAYVGEGSYLISTYNVTPQLYLTINNSGDLEWNTLAAAPADVTQIWTIQEHVSPHDTGFVQITADLSSLGSGSWTMIVDQSTIADANDKDFKITVRPGDPQDDVTVVPPKVDAYGFDQFQRRKTSDYTGPAGTNNALFVKPLGFSGGSRYGVIPTAAGDPVEFNGGGIDAIEYHLVALLSTADFDTSSIFISNPVNNELTIKGLPANVKQVAVYSLLGKEVLTRKVDAQSTLSININTLSRGMYLVKMQSDGGVFTKKIVKQ